MRTTIVVAAISILLGSLTVSAAELKSGKYIPACGGFVGLTCGDKEWCDYPDSAVCGAADQFGTCRPRPDACTEQFLPVCGCNGKTYSNGCLAAAEGFDVAYPGPCRKE